MKENYFTDKNIDLKSKKWIKKISGRRVNSFRENISIKNSALIIVDCQKYFTSSKSHAFIKSSPTVIKRIIKLKDFFIENKRPLILTKHIDDLKNKDNMLLRWWRGYISEKNEFSEIDERVFDKRGIVIKKSSYDAFHNTNLYDFIKKNSIKSVFITGFVANLCCETTARSAFVRNLFVYFGVDTTAAYYENHHLSTLTNLSYGFAIPFLLEDLIITTK